MNDDNRKQEIVREIIPMPEVVDLKEAGYIKSLFTV